ncbi:(2Fe-2S)-binding protein [Paraburkholderia sp. SOS3]|jgi:predicted molibdopterin-dependent oxidoreductase YjgC|uniref:(2Fe-2S)-binding protein n=1 Tax=Paraburkholderia sp. SOS3 TaxID=1926494 RepID=UPI000947542D|nr:(2Fe-2S)-binding protein [Paraburkholderia sp. SOS3]APR39168.1 NAD(FAD)-dependent dehydrogenase [Paraburkholderia sp. SOS3]
MPTSSLFSVPARAGDGAPRITVELDGVALQVPSGCSVAAALLVSGVTRFRSTPVSGSARAPYCMMGVCFECLMEIDGEPNRQTCLIEVRDGMKIRSQEGARDLMAGAVEGHHER